MGKIVILLLAMFACITFTLAFQLPSIKGVNRYEQVDVSVTGLKQRGTRGAPAEVNGGKGKKKRKNSRKSKKGTGRKRSSPKEKSGGGAVLARACVNSVCLNNFVNVISFSASTGVNFNNIAKRIDSRIRVMASKKDKKTAYEPSSVNLTDALGGSEAVTGREVYCAGQFNTTIGAMGFSLLQQLNNCTTSIDTECSSVASVAESLATCKTNFQTFSTELAATLENPTTNCDKWQSLTDFISQNLKSCTKQASNAETDIKPVANQCKSTFGNCKSIEVSTIPVISVCRTSKTQSLHILGDLDVTIYNQRLIIDHANKMFTLGSSSSRRWVRQAAEEGVVVLEAYASIVQRFDSRGDLDNMANNRDVFSAGNLVLNQGRAILTTGQLARLQAATNIISGVLVNVIKRKREIEVIIQYQYTTLPPDEKIPRPSTLVVVPNIFSPKTTTTITASTVSSAVLTTASTTTKATTKTTVTSTTTATTTATTSTVTATTLTTTATTTATTSTVTATTTTTTATTTPTTTTAATTTTITATTTPTTTTGSSTSSSAGTSTTITEDLTTSDDEMTTTKTNTSPMTTSSSTTDDEITTES